MKKTTILMILAMLISTEYLNSQSVTNDFRSCMYDSSANYYSIIDSANSYFLNNIDTAEGNGSASFNRWAEFWKNRVTSSANSIGNFNSYQNAYKQLINTPVCTGNSIVQSDWKPLGPTKNPVAGNVSFQTIGIIISIAIHPNNTNIVYVGGNSSGLWKTTNFLSNEPQWFNVTDNLRIPGLGINDISIDHNNPDIIYIATGITAGAGGGYGAGILKTTNGGSTWTTINPQSINVHNIARRVRISPSNSNILFTLITEDLYKSIDGGTTWTKKFSLPPSIGQNPYNLYAPARLLLDIEFHPTNSNIIYISSDDAPGALYANNNTGALMFRSMDGGENWSQVILDQNGTNSTKLSVAVTPVDPNSVFAAYIDFDTHYQYIKKSLDAGSTWATVSDDDVNYLYTNGFDSHRYDMKISNYNSNIIYIGGYLIEKSTNQGYSFTQKGDFTNMHVDTRVLHIIPDPVLNRDIMLAGNDGGILYTTDGWDSWLKKNGEGLMITQYYGIGVSQTNNHIAGGTQDNDALFYNSVEWRMPWFEKDGGEIVFDKIYPETAYVQKWCCQEGDKHIFKYTYDGSNWNHSGSSSAIDYKPSSIGNRVREMKLHNDGNLYVGYEDIYKGTTPDLTWTKVSDFDINFTEVKSNWKLQTFDVAPSDPDFMIAAYSHPYYNGSVSNPSGRVFRTKSGGGTQINDWTDITQNLPLEIPQWLTITKVLIHPDNPDIIYLTMGGIESDITKTPPYDGYRRVYRSLDEGDTWSDYSNGLTSFPINDIVCLNGSDDELFVATDAGVFYTSNSIYQTDGWVCLNNNLPICFVSDLEVNYNTGKLIAGTFGRGVWETYLPCIEQNQIIISSNETWYNDKRVNANIVISTGNTLSINSGARISMGEDHKIIVEPGAKLIVDDSVIITSGCGSLWQGIEVWGDATKSQNEWANGFNVHQGLVIVKNNACISNARRGIAALKDNMDGTYESSKFGGIIIAYGARFVNNSAGIWIGNYINYKPSNLGDPKYKRYNRSYITNCVFETIENFLPNENFSNFISLLNGSGINITGNSFENTVVTSSYTDKGIGIFTMDFPVNIKGYCTSPNTTPCPGYVPNSFNNLECGIQVFCSLPQPVKIRNNEFTNCRKGIYLNNSRSAEVIENDFYIPPCDENPIWCPRGLYIDGGRGFKVEENTFTSSNGWDGTRGIVVNNTGRNNKEIYKNYFNGLYVGIQPQCRNKGRNPNAKTGLRLFCNVNDNEYFDVFVGGKTEMPGVLGIGIAEAQRYATGDPNKPFLPAGNIFSTNNRVYYTDWDFSNKDAEYLSYTYFAGPSSNKYEPTHYSNILTYPRNDNNTCPTKSGSGSSGLAALYTNRAVARTSLNSSTLLLNIWKDGGNSELDQEVETTLPWEAYVEFNHLMQESPYLSEEVLIAAVENPVFSSLMIKLLMIANPHSSHSEPVLQAIYNRIPPLPESYIEEILDEDGTVSQLELLEADVAADYHLYRIIGEDIKRIYRTDTVNAWAADSLIAFVSQQPELSDHYELAATYLQFGQYEDMQNTLDDIPIIFELDEQEAEDQQDFVTLFDILESIQQNAEFGDFLDESHKQELEAMVLAQKPQISAMAVALLKRDSIGYPYEEVILEPDTSMVPKRLPEKKETENKIYLRLFPNPAYDYVTVSYDSGDEAYEILFLELFDANGRKIFQERVPTGKHERIFSISGFNSGTYVVRILTKGKSLASDKLSILK